MAYVEKYAKRYALQLVLGRPRRISCAHMMLAVVFALIYAWGFERHGRSTK